MKLETFSLENWPKKTDIWCYHCCHSFSTCPLGLPFHYDKKRCVYKVHGVFCSIECMKTYNLIKNDSAKNIRFVYINQMANDIYSTNSINFAPFREELQVFGGHLSIDQFRKQSSKRPKMLYIPPMEPHNEKVSSSNNFSIVHCEAAKTYTKNRPSNEAIKLTRAKPLQNHQNTLELSMGLFSSSS